MTARNSNFDFNFLGFQAGGCLIDVLGHPSTRFEPFLAVGANKFRRHDEPEPEDVFAD